MKPIIFCDFDGTITNSDNIISIMKRFAPAEWEEIANDVLSKRTTISDGVGRMFALLESDKKEEIIDFILTTSEIRKGFKDFVEFTKKEGIPFYVVSGGIDFFVYPMLAGLVEQEQIFCNQAVFTDKFIKIEWPNECDDQCTNGCGCCKPSIMRKLGNGYDFKIVIGDSITDLEASKKADLVLARDFLMEKCEEEKIPYQPFETFYDCMETLKKALGEKE